MAGLDFPVICPRLIGRDEELSALESFLLERESRQGHSILISGEAGIGKTRLATALSERLRSLGWDVLEMACYEQNAHVPYAGIIDLLGRLTRRGEAFLATYVLPYQNALLSLLPGQDKELRQPEQPTDDPGQERERTFATLTQLLLAIAADRPCLLLVDDLHWCDSNTLSALLYLMRHTSGEALAFLMTLRPDDATADVESFLADLERERLSSELRVKPLTLSETDEMLKAIFSTSRSTGIDLLHRLYLLTEGNPFFVEEVLRSVVGDSSRPQLSGLHLEQARIPRTVLEAVRHRVETLSPRSRSLAEVAAVIGTRFDLADLEAIAQLDEAAVLSGLRDLVRGQLVNEEDDGTFAFRHALTREAIVSGLLRREKVILHERIASHFESVHGAADHPEDLSYHFFEAGRWEEAQAYAELAGARALSMFAPAIALEHFSRAIDAASRTGREASWTAYRGRASALEEIGDFERARDDLERAIAIAERDHDLAAQVDCLLDMGLLWASRNYAETLRYSTRAVEIARQVSDQSRLARTLSRLANGLSNTGSFDEAMTFLQEALAIQREQEDRRAIAETLDLVGMTGLMSGRFGESLTAYREALALMETQTDRRNRVSVLASIPVLSGTYQTSMLVPALSLLEATPYAEEAVNLARELAVPSDLSYALWQAGFWLGPQGRYSEAFAAANESLQLAFETGHKQWEAAAHGVLGALHCDVLQPDEAQSNLRKALELSHEINSSLWTAQMSNLLVDALLLGGRQEEAAAWLESESSPDANQPPESMLEVWILSARAEVALARGDFDQVRRTIDIIAKTRRPGLRLVRLRGLVAARTARFDEAIPVLEDVATRAAEQGNRSLQWRVCCDLSHCYLNAGDRERARHAAARARDVIDLVASSLEQPEGFRKAAILQIPAVLRERPARTQTSPLTTREAEIAGLIAAGLTNREIAEHLVLSTRTVETHVANALAKLGFSARAQLSAWFIGHNAPSA